MFLNENDDFEAKDQNRQIANLVTIGLVHEVDASRARARVEIDNALSGWLPWLAKASDDKSWHAPEVNEQVVVLSIAGEINQGIILGSLYQELFDQPFRDQKYVSAEYADGTKIVLNKTEKELEITISEGSGRVILHAGKITVNSNDIRLGGEEGRKVARIGDRVEVGSGSSQGLWPIVEGSNKVRAE